MKRQGYNYIVKDSTNLKVHPGRTNRDPSVRLQEHNRTSIGSNYNLVSYGQSSNCVRDETKILRKFNNLYSDNLISGTREHFQASNKTEFRTMVNDLKNIKHNVMNL